MSDLANATPAAASTASPSQGTGAPQSGNIQPSGEAGQGATGTDNFIPQGVDINTLPPAVRAELDRINKEMVRGFTAKTEKLANDAKKYEGFDTFKQEAELYRQFSGNPEFVKVWNEHVAKLNAQNNPVPGDPVAAKLQELESQLKEEKAARQEAEMGDILEAFATAKNENGEFLNPDFEKLNTYKLGASKENGEYSLLRACMELASGQTPQERIVNGYKIAKGIKDAIFEEGRKHQSGKNLARLRNSTETPAMTTDKTEFNGDARKLTVREARELAEKGVVVR